MPVAATQATPSAPQATVRPASSAPSRSARPTAPAGVAGQGRLTAVSRDRVARSAAETGSTAQTARGASNMIAGLQQIHGANPGAEARRASGVDPALEHHYAGAPAAPFTGRLQRDSAGHVQTGVLQNDHTDRNHHYVTVSALPAGLTPQQAEQTFRRFNAPTTDAITPGRNGNDPSTRDAYVNPGVFHNSALTRATAPTAAGLMYGVPAEHSGGHVDTRQGTTPNGRPWALNSTRENEHPLMGHITRTLVNEDGRYYIRTEGVGEGTRGAWNGPMNPHLTNSIVGPNSFQNLDRRAGEWASERFGVAPPAPAPSLPLLIPGLPPISLPLQ